ncbi:Beta-mannosidase [Trichinella spiralis]|uniref:beta-mannosidase n=1 Tax=Trichinella spiralis TaxID=6334 RepID=A0A0V1BW18_TRISP|nr:Beta-mannosidase [Trichinella spiralis]
MGSGNGVDKSLDLRLIPEFDGSPQQSVVEWLEKVELVCKLRDISDVASDRSSIDKVKEALLAAFAADPFVAYDQFVSRKLGPDESPDVFLADLRKLATLFGGDSGESTLDTKPQSPADKILCSAEKVLCFLSTMKEHRREMKNSIQRRRSGEFALDTETTVSSGEGTVLLEYHEGTSSRNEVLNTTEKIRRVCVGYCVMMGRPGMTHDYTETTITSGEGTVLLEYHEGTSPRNEELNTTEKIWRVCVGYRNHSHQRRRKSGEFALDTETTITSGEGTVLLEYHEGTSPRNEELNTTGNMQAPMQVQTIRLTIPARRHGSVRPLEETQRVIGYILTRIFSLAAKSHLVLYGLFQLLIAQQSVVQKLIRQVLTGNAAVDDFICMNGVYDEKQRQVIQYRGGYATATIYFLENKMHKCFGITFSLFRWFSTGECVSKFRFGSFYFKQFPSFSHRPQFVFCSRFTIDEDTLKLIAEIAEERNLKIWLLSEDGTDLGKMSLADAKTVASRRNLRLWSVGKTVQKKSENQVSIDDEQEEVLQLPVYQLISGKELFDKRNEENKKKAKNVKEKILRVHSTISQHDLEAKMNHVFQLLEKKHPIRIEIISKSEENTNSTERFLDNIKTLLQDKAAVASIQPSTGVQRFNISNLHWQVRNENGSISFNATIPGNIYTDLFNAGYIDDPYLYNHDVSQRWVAYQNWIYEVNVTLPLIENMVCLVFYGLDTFATVVINGIPLGHADNMHLAYPFCVHSLNDKQFHLSVAFTSPVVKASELATAFKRDFGYSVPPDCPQLLQNGECHANFVRKMSVSFSWDWAPAFPGVGIWKEASVWTVRGCAIWQFAVSPVLDEDGKFWNLHVHFVLFCASAEYCLFSVKINNLKWQWQSQLNFGKNFEFRLVKCSVRDVRLWWPTGHGDQPLYTVRGAVVGSNWKDSRSVRTAFRHVELVQRDLVKGKSFEFFVNGVSVFLKGANWVPADSFLHRVTPQRLQFLFDSILQANMNCLRVWGGGVYESDLFYEMADRYGILIWQDIMFAVSFYPADEDFLYRVKTELKYQILRLMHHPSIFVWSANNEIELALAKRWYPTTVSYSTFRADYMRLVWDTIYKVVNETDFSARPFILSSPSNGINTTASGGIADDPNSDLYGDVHFYDYMSDMLRDDNYPIPRCVSEFGVQSLPDLETWRSAGVDPDSAKLFSAEVLHRQHHPLAHFSMLQQTMRHFPLPAQNKSTLSTYVLLTQLHQALVYKTAVEHWRRWRHRLDESTGRGWTSCVLYWQLNDIWQAPSWSTVDYGLKWKLAHYYAVKFYAPLLVTANCSSTSGRCSVFVVSDLTFQLVNVTVEVRFYCWDWPDPLASIKRPVGSVPPQGSLLVFEFPFGNFFHLVTLAVLNSSTGLPLGPVNTHLLTKIPRLDGAEVGKVEVVGLKALADRRFLITLRRFGPIVPFVWLRADNLTGYFSDNGFVMVDRRLLLTFQSYSQISLSNFRSQLRITTIADHHLSICFAFLMITGERDLVSFVDTVRDWSVDDVAQWLVGLDETVEPFSVKLCNAFVDGRRLLLLTASDLVELGVDNLISRQIIVNALNLLVNLCFEMDSENLQSIALQLGAFTRNVMNKLYAQQSQWSRKRTNTKLQSMPNTVLSEVACLAGQAKKFLFWLDREPFNTDEQFKVTRNSVLHLVVQIVQLAQMPSDDLCDVARNVQMLCTQLAAICDEIVENSADPLVLQTAFLETVLIRRHSVDDELGFNIEAPYKGVHMISEVKYHSPVDVCGKVHAGDEIVQVNGRTVVGWQVKSVASLLIACKSKEVTLLLKKRPRQHLGMMKARNSNTSYPVISSLPAASPRMTKKPRRSNSLGYLHVTFEKMSISKGDDIPNDSCVQSYPLTEACSKAFALPSESFIKYQDRRRATIATEESEREHGKELDCGLMKQQRRPFSEAFLSVIAPNHSDLNKLNLNYVDEEETDDEEIGDERYSDEVGIEDQSMTRLDGRRLEGSFRYATVELADEKQLADRGIRLAFTSADWEQRTKTASSNADHRLVASPSACDSCDKAGVPRFSTRRMSDLSVEMPLSCSLSSPAPTDLVDLDDDGLMSASFRSCGTTPLIYPRSRLKLRKFFGEAFDTAGESRWYFDAGSTTTTTGAAAAASAAATTTTATTTITTTTTTTTTRTATAIDAATSNNNNITDVDLSSPRTYTGVNFEGWVYQARCEGIRTRHSIHRWVKRWLVLKGVFLYIYVDAESFQPDLVIKLSKCKICPPGPEMKTRKKNVFKIQNEDMILYFKCEHYHEMLLWLKKLGLAAIGYVDSEQLVHCHHRASAGVAPSVTS